MGGRLKAVSCVMSGLKCSSVRNFSILVYFVSERLSHHSFATFGLHPRSSLVFHRVALFTLQSRRAYIPRSRHNHIAPSMSHCKPI